MIFLNNISPLKINAALLIVLSAFLFLSFNNQQISSKDIIDKMNSSIEKISTLKFKLKKKERVDGKLKTGEQDVKFNRNPKKVYTKVISPNKGVEVLWVEEENDNKAFINPNGFPYVTLSLDPYGSNMRNNNHHTLHQVGFDYINDIIKYITQKSGDNFDLYFKYKGDTVFNNKECYKILIDYAPFAYINYTVKAGETVTDIAHRLYISDYMILQLNPSIDNYEDVKAGQIIKIPNAYAKKTILCIDKKTHLPIVQKMYDDKGLFSQYEFYNLQLNITIPTEEFTKEYKDYNF